MSDYISREAALTELQNPELFNVSPRFLQILRDLPAADVEPVRNGQLCEVLEETPTVDAVHVVRCRDCIAFEEIGKHPTNNGGTPFGYCYHWEYEQGMSPNEVDGNDFCSYGKRKVDENGRT